ncbi:MAG TPA: VCBS repeat-containing protein [Puia sp.]|nr:VCBS repeat-containing protein [Puia sp.]
MRIMKKLYSGSSGRWRRSRVRRGRAAGMGAGARLGIGRGVVALTQAGARLGVAAALLLFSCGRRAETLFSVVPPPVSHVDFANNLPDRPDLSILDYVYYYNGGGVAVGDINNDGLPDLYFTGNGKGKNKLYLNKGNFVFEDITDKAGVAGSADWCTGVTMADVNGDGFLDIYVCAVANTMGFTGHNELFINNGNGTFTESSAAYGLDFSGFSTQAVFFDYDHDGDLDCFILNQSQHPNAHIVDTSARRGYDANAGERLYRNDGTTGATAGPGAGAGGRSRTESQAAAGGHPHFTDVTAQAGLYRSSLCYGLGVAVGDLNNDGWEDIYIGNDFHENDFYYINNGDGTFTESGARHFRHYSRYSMGNDIADFNNDGQLDVVTADMLPRDERTLKTYGNGEHLDTYEEKITRNGYQDQYSRNCLQRNNGDGVSFSDIGLISGISATDWSWSALFADLDNDGNKDLFITSGIVKRPLDLDFISFSGSIRDPAAYGSPEELRRLLDSKMPDGASHPFVFRGDGEVAFADSSDAWGVGGLKGYFNGAAYADLDNDGRLDLVINCINAPAVILRNNGPRRHWLSVAFEGGDSAGAAGASMGAGGGGGSMGAGNRFGIGAKAYVYASGKLQYQQLMLTRGFESSVEPRLHFGLGDATVADSVLIVWPRGRWQLLRHVAADKPLVVREAEAAPGFTRDRWFPQRKAPLEDVSADVKLGWRHREDSFDDFKQQYLIPHQESARGPRLAVADVNHDGLDDLFVCGARGQAGALFIQSAGGSFVRADSTVFARNAGSEGVDAVFFDANGDGYPDLYVVSGGNEAPDGDSSLRDHFYLNDGKGHFRECMDCVPQLLTNKSCVAAADVNGDGYIDLFVGGLTSAGKYGVTDQSCELLLNDGRGHFRSAVGSSAGAGGGGTANGEVFPSQQRGIVTSAAFADLDGDGRPDLVVAGEWMGVKIFYNRGGVFREQEIDGSSGLWQCVAIADVNGDGHPDILAGNWGHNSKLYAGKDGPLKLYVKDFESSGINEQLLTYRIGGVEYPFYGKDQLELALPLLKHSRLRYDEVAGKPVQNLFGAMLDGSRVFTAQMLGSTCFINDGKGHFSPMELPWPLQLSPVFAFAAVEAPREWLAVGNFYGVQPYEGRYDAMDPTVFTYDHATGQGGDKAPQDVGDKATPKLRYAYELPAIGGEFRDAKWLRGPKGRRMLVLARNNAAPVFLRVAP